MTTLEALESCALILLRFRARTVATPAITSEMIETAVKQVGALFPHTLGEELQARVNLAERLIPRSERRA
jgi:hypothetical protein